MPCPSHSPWLDHSNYVGEEYKLWSSSLCSFLQSPVTSSLFGSNILPSTLFSNTLSLNLCYKQKKNIVFIESVGSLLYGRS
jgi:hypothetical protein